MGWFGYGLWGGGRIQSLRVEGKTNDEALFELLQEIEMKMIEHGNQSERDLFNRVKEDFLAIRRTNITDEELLHYANLLIGSINLWSTGKRHAQHEEGLRFRQRMMELNPRFNAKYDMLFPFAEAIYRLNQGQLGKFELRINEWEKPNNSRATKEACQLMIQSIRQGKKFFLENASLTYRACLVEANKYQKTFTVEEFNRNQMEIEDAFAKYRKRKARKKGHRVQ